MNETWSGRRVLLGAGGGIAAYKAPELVRALTREGAQVRVVLTESAEQFVSPLALQALSQQPVGRSLFDPGWEHQIGHIELARWADAIIVAPATANLVARLAHGMADDLLTTVILASRAPVLVCPSMNTQMLAHAATQANLEILRQRAGCVVVAPDAGDLACGETGAGRLPDPDVILQHLGRTLAPQRLAGQHVVVTAGPTREAFDAVRFLSNRSSGKMGYALALEAWRAGARVTLISGPVTLPPPAEVHLVRVTSAAQMHQAVLDARAEVLIMAAAVADYTPAELVTHKRKKSAGDWTPTLVRTRDILSDLAEHPQRPPVVVGFAAETEEVEAYAQGKLDRKRLDGIVGNSVAGPDGAFENDHNTVVLLAPQRPAVHLGPAPKRAVARGIIDWIASLPAHVR
jgi:phosphopantothenoylcysteine decarboxylase/phosphopantothenate--cysteine ligase